MKYIWLRISCEPWLEPIVGDQHIPELEILHVPYAKISPKLLQKIRNE